MAEHDHYHPDDHPDFTRDVSEASRDVWTADLVDRMARVEHKLRMPLHAIQGGRPAPIYTPEDLWEMANELSIPTPIQERHPAPEADQATPNVD